MATTAQTPQGRGFSSSLGYFHSFNDYFNEQRPTQCLHDRISLSSRCNRLSDCSRLKIDVMRPSILCAQERRAAGASRTLISGIRITLRSSSTAQGGRKAMRRHFSARELSQSCGVIPLIDHCTCSYFLSSVKLPWCQSYIPPGLRAPKTACQLYQCIWPEPQLSTCMPMCTCPQIFVLRAPHVLRGRETTWKHRRCAW